MLKGLYRGWGIRAGAARSVKQSLNRFGLSREARAVAELADEVAAECTELTLNRAEGRRHLATALARDIIDQLAGNEDEAEATPLFAPLTDCLLQLMQSEAWFALPSDPAISEPPNRSELWAIEDGLQRTAAILAAFDATMETVVALFVAMLRPVADEVPALVQSHEPALGDIPFMTPLSRVIHELPEVVDGMVQYPFVPELDEHELLRALRERLQYNLIVASGGAPADPRAAEKANRFPTKALAMAPEQLLDTYLAGTPQRTLFDVSVPITIPQATRFEHQSIVAGSGHGKTQTLQHFLLHDFEAVARGEASVVVIDSQSDLINTISGLSPFAPGEPLHDRLVLIDPTDVEWPVALNLFDFGLERIDQYSALDRERLINGVLELYDFVLGSLLDAGMTQKQSVIFRYVMRLLMHIPDATIHTFRELLEDDGLEPYRDSVAELTGTARAFFESEYESREFVSTRRQVLRRLYGILENQTFERMFSHPKSKLDLFAEMNAGKVILINTAKDLLKENGTEIFGRFFIAMIAQTAQERAVLPPEQRLPTFVYVDEASDYFDRTLAVILSQARKQKVGIIAANQYLGQMDTKLAEAMAANTAIKFAGGVSAKDARAMAGDLRANASFIEDQDKLSFAAFIRGTTKRAISVSIKAGQMEALPRLNAEEREAQREAMRAAYAVHYSEIGQHDEEPKPEEPDAPHDPPDDDEPDTGEPIRWE